MIKASQKLFCFSAGLILAMTGLIKVWSAFGSTEILTVADPVFGLSFGHLMFATGTVEMVIAVICLFGRNSGLATSLIAWLGTVFLVYRLGLLWGDYHKPCSCLGNLTDALHIPPQTADTAMKVVLGYLLVGSYAILFWLWRQRRRPYRYCLQ